MGRAGRMFLVLGGLVAAIALFLVLRADDDSAGPTAATEPTTSQSATTTETGSTTTEPPPPPPPPAGPRRIRLTIPPDGPEGIREIEVEQGKRVVLVIRSGVVDHAHLHGYDLMADVGPGIVARIRFRADIPGRFELELEDRGQQFAELTVAP